jgi:hypothetical protein
MQEDNSKYRRMLKRLPAELREILDALKSRYTVESYAPQYLGWAAEVRVSSHRFQLVAEFKHIVVSETVDGVEHLLTHRTGEDITSGTACVAQRINDRIA